MLVFRCMFDQVNICREKMTFEEEFFEMAQALEENSDMLNVSKKLSDTQVNSLQILFKIPFSLFNRNVLLHI